MSIRYKGKRFLAVLAVACMIFSAAPVQRVMASPAEDGAKAPAEISAQSQAAGTGSQGQDPAADTYLGGASLTMLAPPDRRPEYVVFTAD